MRGLAVVSHALKSISLRGRKKPWMQLRLRMQIWVWVLDWMSEPSKAGPPSVKVPRVESKGFVFEKPFSLISCWIFVNTLSCIHSITVQSRYRRSCPCVDHLLDPCFEVVLYFERSEERPCR